MKASRLGAVARTAAVYRIAAAILHADPLVASRRHVARERCVRRDELRLRYLENPKSLEVEQVVAVGAATVQQYHKAGGLAAGDRWAGRAGTERTSIGAARFLRTETSAVTGITDARARCHCVGPHHLRSAGRLHRGTKRTLVACLALRAVAIALCLLARDLDTFYAVSMPCGRRGDAAVRDPGA